ncbi:MAG: radical SAM protein [Kiritimatiellae bacterium]|nr:radical SAM protein [Kiritimatiellia bacterium]
MISLSNLYFGNASPGDALRFGNEQNAERDGDSPKVVAWNLTNRCNLACRHCYADANTSCGEMSSAEAKDVLRSLAQCGVCAVLFSGGEPLMRNDVFELAHFADRLGLRVTLSSNGTLIDAETARKIAAAHMTYAGLSIDGDMALHDAFRGMKGAYSRTLAAFGHLREAGVKAGLRVTLTRSNAGIIPEFFALMRREAIPRACFYHLMPSGRGVAMGGEMLSQEETCNVLDAILQEMRKCHEASFEPEVLTVGRASDGEWLLERMQGEAHPLADRAEKLLQRQRSGGGIVCISWDGTVHPNQFMRGISLGNVRFAPLAEILRRAHFGKCDGGLQGAVKYDIIHPRHKNWS